MSQAANHRYTLCKKLTDPNDPEYDPQFLVCTLLDTQYRLLFNRTQMDSAKEHLLKLLKEEAENGGSDSSQSPQSPAVVEEEPPVKRFCHLARILKQKLKDNIKKVVKRPPGEQEVEQYLSNVPSLPHGEDPVMFWIEQEKNFPLLAPLAVDLLIIPGSSAPIE